MTPLYKHICTDFGKKPHRRKFCDYAGVLPLLRESQVFDCRQLMGATSDMILAHQRNEIDLTERARLPATNLYLELMIGDSSHGFLIDGANTEGGFETTLYTLTAGGSALAGRMLEDYVDFQHDLSEKTAYYIIARLSALLWLINSPKSVKCVNQNPKITHKRAARSAGWPIGAWRECRVVVDGETINTASHDLHGKMPYHYVRGHFKQSIDKWIEGYFRGNKEHGEVRTVHKCVTKAA